MKYRIFISSVQREFAAERKKLKQYLLSDPLLGEYVESVFIFEDHPAAKKRPGEIYLPKLADTDIYIGLFGAQYGNRVPEGEMSPTEREYDAATAHGLTKWIYVFDDETPVDPRMARLRKKAAGDHTYRHVKDRSMINQEVYASFISFLRERNELTREPFESVVVPDALLEDDIDHERVRWFVDTARRERKLAAKVGETDEKLLVHLKLMNRKTRALSRAAIMLFGKDPQSVCLSAKIKCVCCAGTQYRRPFVLQVYEGDLFDQVDQAEIFVLNHIDTTVGIRTDSVQAPTTYEIPPRAIREVIVNAVAHRDYASTASVEVRVFSDRVEVWNPGELPPGKTVAWLFDEHESMPFNPLIAAAFYQARYIEHVGSGIEDIEVACAEAGLPQTTVDVRNRTIVHTIWRKTTKETGKTSKKTAKENEATTKETVGTTKEISLTTKEIPLSLRVHLEGFSDVARAIFKFFWDHREHSAESAAKEFGLTPDGVRYHIKKLKQGNLLHHEGPTKKGRWVFGPKPKGKRGAK